MTIHALIEEPEPALADALEAFERTFTYPLGPGKSFSISHGRDYPRFFRAIESGTSASFIAIGKDGGIRGTLGVTVRPVQFPNGLIRMAAYLGDLKTAPGAGRGWTLLRLAAEATLWSTARGAVVGYGVVMDGTPRAPSDYTGKFGMHAFRAVASLSILRISVQPSCTDERGDSSLELNVVPSSDGVIEHQVAAVEDCFRHLSSGRFAPLGGSPQIRSSFRPLPLIASDHSACGILEDTRLAKRLLLEEGQEMLAAHLSSFAYANPAAGASFIREALNRCVNTRLAPAMFVAIPKPDLSAFTALLGDIPDIVIAPATIYGTGPGLSEGNWNISTSEI